MVLSVKLSVKAKLLRDVSGIECLLWDMNTTVGLCVPVYIRVGLCVCILPSCVMS